MMRREKTHGVPRMGREGVRTRQVGEEKEFGHARLVRGRSSDTPGW